jgi:transposase
MADTHSDAIAARLKGFQEKLVKVGVESGQFTPHLHHSLAGMGFPMVRRRRAGAADTINSRRLKSDKAEAFALAEMLHTGWFTAVHVKSAESHKIKTLLGARDQLVRVKRRLQSGAGPFRPFGARLPSRAGMKKFAEAAYQAAQNDRLLQAGIAALLEALATIEAHHREGIVRSSLHSREDIGEGEALVASPADACRASTRYGKRGPSGRCAPHPGRTGEGAYFRSADSISAASAASLQARTRRRIGDRKKPPRHARVDFGFGQFAEHRRSPIWVSAIMRPSIRIMRIEITIRSTYKIAAA